MDVDDLERLLTDVHDPAVEPLAGECLGHYLCRVLAVAGCRNDHRLTRLWAARRRRCDPGALVRWAGTTGGCCCDCEVVMNSLRRRSAATRSGVLCEAARACRRGCATAGTTTATTGRGPAAACPGRCRARPRRT